MCVYVCGWESEGEKKEQNEHRLDDDESRSSGVQRCRGSGSSPGGSRTTGPATRLGIGRRSCCAWLRRLAARRTWLASPTAKHRYICLNSKTHTHAHASLSWFVYECISQCICTESFYPFYDSSFIRERLLVFFFFVFFCGDARDEKRRMLRLIIKLITCGFNEFIRDG